MTSEAIAARQHRRWANGSEPSLFELISDSYGALLPPGSILQIRSVVVDADVLLKEIVAEVKRPGEVVLYAASRLGLLRIYVADTIPSEVERNLERVCAETRRDYAAARTVWANWRPHLRVVTTPTVIPAEVSGVALSDIPTAELALTLGRGLVWSNDHSLQRNRLAQRYPLGAALAVRNVSGAEMNAHISLRVSGGLLEGSVQLAQRAWLAVGPNGQLAILGAIAVLLGVGFAHRRVIASKLGESAPQMLTAISQGIERVRDWYLAELKKLPPVPVLEAGLPLEHQVARTLAYAALPLTAPEIVERLASHKIVVTVEEVRAALAASPIFVRSGRWYWQLGL